MSENEYELTIVVGHEAGLHLRPASLFVQTAASFKSDIKIKNKTKGTPFENGKSSIGIMKLAIDQGHEVTIKAKGEDAQQAVSTLKNLIETNFENQLE